MCGTPVAHTRTLQTRHPAIPYTSTSPLPTPHHATPYSYHHTKPQHTMPHACITAQHAFHTTGPHYNTPQDSPHHAILHHATPQSTLHFTRQHHNTWHNTLPHHPISLPHHTTPYHPSSTFLPHTTQHRAKQYDQNTHTQTYEQKRRIRYSAALQRPTHTHRPYKHCIAHRNQSTPLSKHIASPFRQ